MTPKFLDHGYVSIAGLIAITARTMDVDPLSSTASLVTLVATSDRTVNAYRRIKSHSNQRPSSNGCIIDRMTECQ